MPDGTVFPEKKAVTDAKIEEILGLSVEQFSQIVMSAQGDFLKLLYTKTDERKKIFSKLFQTDKYWRIQEELKRRSFKLDELIEENKRDYAKEQARIMIPDALREHWEEGAMLVKPDEMPLTVLLEEIYNMKKELDAEFERSQKAVEKVAMQLSGAEEINKQFEALEKLLQSQTVFLEKAQEEKLRQSRIINAKAADKICTFEEKYNQATEELLRVQKLLEKLAGEVEKSEEQVQRTMQQYQEEQAVFVEKEKVWQKELLLLEQTLPAYEKLDEAMQRLIHTNEKMKAVESAYERYALAKALGVKKLLQEVSLQKQREEEAARELLQAQQCAKEKAKDYERLYRVFLENQAGILARGLKEDCPCPVCGSLHHPKLAQVLQEEVSEQMVEDAKEARNQAEAVRDVAYRSFEEMKNVYVIKAHTYEQEYKAFEREMEVDWETFLRGRDLTDRLESDSLEIVSKADVLQYKTEVVLVETEVEQLKKGLIFVSKYEALKQQETIKNQLEKAKKHLQQLEQKLAVEKQSLQEKCGQEKQERARLRAYEKAVTTTAKEYKEVLERSVFETEEAYKEAYLSEIRREKLERESREYREKCQLLDGQIKTWKAALKGKERQETKKWKEMLKEAEETRKQLEKKKMQFHTAYQTNRLVLEKSKAYLEKEEQLAKEDKVVKSLYKTAGGRLSGSAKIDFETYIQRQYFKQIIHEANKRLLTMSGQQFMLKLKDESEAGKRSNEGLDLSVYSLITNSERDVKTLSGGEAFLAALAMALGLSDIVGRNAGAIGMDMMFIDEGFGSLDANARNQAISILQQLAGDKRIVGIISHVTELKEQIDHKLVVRRSDKGSRVSWEIS